MEAIPDLCYGGDENQTESVVFKDYVGKVESKTKVLRLLGPPSDLVIVSAVTAEFKSKELLPLNECGIQFQTVLAEKKTLMFGSAVFCLMVTT